MEKRHLKLFKGLISYSVWDGWTKHAMSPDEDTSFDDDVDTSEMPINMQKKGWEDILRKQCIEKVSADPDEIDISSYDSDLEGNDHIEAIEGDNPRILFAAALQMLNQLQDFASSFTDTEM